MMPFEWSWEHKLLFIKLQVRFSWIRRKKKKEKKTAAMASRCNYKDIQQRDRQFRLSNLPVWNACVMMYYWIKTYNVLRGFGVLHSLWQLDISKCSLMLYSIPHVSFMFFCIFLSSEATNDDWWFVTVDKSLWFMGYFFLIQICKS